MKEFLFELNSSEKTTCPSCLHENCFVRYINNSTGRYLEGDYGRCDRENNCGYFHKPTNNRPLKHKVSELYVSQSLYDCDFIHFKFYDDMYYNKDKNPNTFLRELTKIFGREKVLAVREKYLLGTWLDGACVFPYLSYRNLLHTAKIIWYGKDLKRIKTGKKRFIKWLHSANYKSDDGYEYNLMHEGRHPVPFFGNHLLNDENVSRETPVIIVESEKSAVIMSMIYPDYIWLGSGGLQNIQKYKFTDFQMRDVYVLPDLGIVKSEQISTRDFWLMKLNEALEKATFSYKFINYVPENMPITYRESWVDQGKDVVDFLFEYETEWLKGKYDSYFEYLNEVLLNNII